MLIEFFIEISKISKKFLDKNIYENKADFLIRDLIYSQTFQADNVNIR